MSAPRTTVATPQKNGHKSGKSRAPEPQRSAEAQDLMGIAVDALKISPPLYVSSIFGQPWTWLPPYDRYSEFKILDLWRLRRALKYLLNISLPSLPMTPPPFGPPLLNDLFWQPTVILQRPDHNGSYTSFLDEAWFFINGILTNDAVAQINAAYLAYLFHRPITLIQNSTDGLVIDLLQSALGKQWRRITEPATKAFEPVYDALKSRDKRRVVLIAHSQGSIIAATVLRLLKAITRPAAPLARAARYAPPEFVYPADEIIDLTDFEPLEESELAKLEIYSFATCATHMTYYRAGDSHVPPIPWIEHFGNEMDMVARLGMLAPRPAQFGIAIDGPRYQRKGGWGHLLNAHYLHQIERHQRKGRKKGAAGGREPFHLLEGPGVAAPDTPRLFQYINGGVPKDG